MPGCNSQVLMELTISYFHGDALSCLAPILSRLTLAVCLPCYFCKQRINAQSSVIFRVWELFFCILENGLFISWAKLTQKLLLPSPKPCIYCWGLLGSFWYRLCLRKWTYTKIFQSHWILLATLNNPAIFWISPVSAWSSLLLMAAMLYHQLFCLVSLSLHSELSQGSLEDPEKKSAGLHKPCIELLEPSNRGRSSNYYPAHTNQHPVEPGKWSI